MARAIRLSRALRRSPSPAPSRRSEAGGCRARRKGCVRPVLHSARRRAFLERSEVEVEVESAARAMQFWTFVTDLLLIVATVAFFAVSWAYVRFCDRLGGAP